MSFWDTRILAEAEESRLHKEYKVASNPRYFNMTESTATGFSNYGMVSVLDLRGELHQPEGWCFLKYNG